ncbi:flagellar protein FliS [Desulfacinum hydrothermale DSM 13146]|uniref:Flagellar protein FliS n=1 Tax=Desulfacinum hydrothermale DSM 13146 TaxID=1121390 RepID=A0A1W1XEG6_9BACT|nr:flagellar export chaperone FliS [Desulfacinum hydrothermale]SMC22435.1 flagellar protein FliS [Desulfacinum hydrothermale DSM 13146]
MNAQALPAFQNGDVSQDDFLHLIVRCYDAMLQDFREAQHAHSRGDEEQLMDRIRHAQDLVTELLIGLDYERGGEVAQNLGRIYNYMLKELVAIRDSQAQQTLDRLIAMTGELRDAWGQLACAG